MIPRGAMTELDRLRAGLSRATDGEAAEALKRVPYDAYVEAMRRKSAALDRCRSLTNRQQRKHLDVCDRMTVVIRGYHAIARA